MQPGPPAGDSRRSASAQRRTQIRKIGLVGNRNCGHSRVPSLHLSFRWRRAGCGLVALLELPPFLRGLIVLPVNQVRVDFLGGPDPAVARAADTFAPPPSGGTCVQFVCR
jgi:hypothetical protein